MIRILLADDHQVLLDGILHLVDQESDMEVIALAHHGDEVLAKMQKISIDVLVLDINMPGKDGMQVCEEIHTRYPHTPILVLSMHKDSHHISSMLEQGAKGYVSKQAAYEELIQAIRAVYAGETYLSYEIEQALAHGHDEMIASEEETFTIQLSRREKEVLQLIVEEHTTQEIADKLFISIKTVETHRKNLLVKLNARNTAGLVRIAMEKGLV